MNNMSVDVMVRNFTNKNKIKNMKATLYFHQGMTDVVNCLGMINYYSDLYEELYVILRSDVSEMINYYINGLDNVHPIYIETENGLYFNDIRKHIINNSDILFFGEHDYQRVDNYKMIWHRNQEKVQDFVSKFYTLYGLDYNIRVNNFNLKRDYDKEESVYQDFLKKNGKDYILIHDNPTWNSPTEIDIKGDNIINLNKTTNIFFDYIKIIENAKEIHLIDSVWACILYLIDARYNLFSHLNINVFCKRGHYYMFNNPIKLKNWKLI